MAVKFAPIPKPPRGAISGTGGLPKGISRPPRGGGLGGGLGRVPRPPRSGK